MPEVVSMTSDTLYYLISYLRLHAYHSMHISIVAGIPNIATLFGLLFGAERLGMTSDLISCR